MKAWIWAWLVDELVSLTKLTVDQYQHHQRTSSSSLLRLVEGPALGKPQTSTWPPEIAQTRDVHMAFGGNMGHGHRHRPLLLQGHRPRQGPSSNSTSQDITMASPISPSLCLCSIVGSYHLVGVGMSLDIFCLLIPADGFMTVVESQMSFFSAKEHQLVRSTSSQVF